MYLHDLDVAARKSGLIVRTIPGWRWRGRTTGSFAPIGQLDHHTGGSSDDVSYIKWMALTGRSDLPAPLCQLALTRKGVVYVCAAGRANHAGKSRGSGPIPAGDGNSLLVGTEALNTGSEGWGSEGRDAYGRPVTQGEAFARLNAALCQHYRWGADTTRAHAETSTTGKWDPGLLDMNRHRADVARLIPNPAGLEWSDMATEDELRTVVRQELAKLPAGNMPEPGKDGRKAWSLTRLLWSTRNIMLRIERRTKAIERRLAAVENTERKG